MMNKQKLGQNSKTVTVKTGSWAIPMFFLFLVLKLTNTVDWSWWWITSPLWVPAAVALGCLAIFLIVIMLIGIVSLIFNK